VYGLLIVERERKFRGKCRKLGILFFSSARKNEIPGVAGAARHAFCRTQNITEKSGLILFFKAGPMNFRACVGNGGLKSLMEKSEKSAKTGTLERCSQTSKVPRD
jgi:hypothetical protein